MSDPNEKTASVLLKINGKTHRINLYDFAQFSRQKEDEGKFRVKIDGRWHCPGGKYTAFSPAALAALLVSMIDGTPPPPPPDIKPGTRVYAHWQGGDDELCCGMAWTATPPHLGIDGRWHVWLDGNRLARCEDVRPLTPEELRQARRMLAQGRRHGDAGKSGKLRGSPGESWGGEVMKEIVIEGFENALKELNISLPDNVVESMADCVLDDDTGPEVLRDEFRRELEGVTVTEEKLDALVWAGLAARSEAFVFIA